MSEDVDDLSPLPPRTTATPRDIDRTAAKNRRCKYCDAPRVDATRCATHRDKDRLRDRLRYWANRSR
jgi:hypothetical protein